MVKDLQKGDDRQDAISLPLPSVPLTDNQMDILFANLVDDGGRLRGEIANILNDKPEETGQLLVKLLREKGPEDPEVCAILQLWTRQQEKIVEAANTSEAAIQFNLRRARLYFEAGYKDEAWKNFEAAHTQAYQEGMDELMHAIDAEENRLFPPQ